MAEFPIPLNALHAIEIVARTGALKPAADELGVTIGAVSQHIRRRRGPAGRRTVRADAAGIAADGDARAGAAAARLAASPRSATQCG